MGDEVLQCRVLTGLHEAEMAFRQRKCGITAENAEDFDPARLQRAAQHRLVLGAAHLVEDDTGDTDIIAVASVALHQGSHGLRHTAAIDNKHHGQIQHGGQIGRRAGAIHGPIEQAHHRLDEQEAALNGLERGVGAYEIRSHRPGIIVEAGRPAGGGVKGRIDIIRPRLAGDEVESGSGEGPRQPQRHRRLTGAGGRRCNE